MNTYCDWITAQNRPELDLLARFLAHQVNTRCAFCQGMGHRHSECSSRTNFDKLAKLLNKKDIADILDDQFERDIRARELQLAFVQNHNNHN